MIYGFGMVYTSNYFNFKKLNLEKTQKGLSAEMLGFFFNPVIKEYHLADVPKNVSCLGGISALANYTMLGDNSYRTYVCGKEDAKKHGLDSCLKIPKYEVPACNVQVLKYVIEWNGCIDPISAVLSISEKDRRDPRVEGAIEEVLEEVFDGRWNREI
ncbi:MAG: hypothetical protein PHV18_05860 [Lachnospiraceae bacterium]|nr:hypothetical protein [Lachnospiraceae bacterium]